tara:strand:- start:1419 stop:2222 length:804 start_codon:yes stop_codon:yes gene_type:complete
MSDNIFESDGYDSNSDDEMINVLTNESNDNESSDLLLSDDIECQPIIYFHNYEKYSDLEYTDQIVLPHEFLDIVSKDNDVKYPLIFEIESNNNIVYCTVREFIIGIENIYVPNRIYNNLLLSDSNKVKIKCLKKNIPIGNRITIQPHTSDFLKIENHKEMLEKALENNYTILSENDVITVNNMGKNYDITILKCEPENKILIINTDIEVDFEKPLDYVEPKPEKIKDKYNKEEDKDNTTFKGEGNTLDKGNVNDWKENFLKRFEKNK